MGYLFVGIACLCGAVKGYCGKKTSGSADTLSGAMLINTVRMLLCIVIGFFFILLYERDVTALAVNGKLLLISALSGLGTSLFVVSWLLAVRQGAYMMLDVFLTLGVLVPLLLCYFLFGDPIAPLQWVGLGLLLIATYIMCTYNNRIKKRMTFASFLLLVLCGAANGVSSFAQKWFIHDFPAGSTTVFNFYTYVFSAAVLIIPLLAVICKGRLTKKGAAVPRTQNALRVVTGVLPYLVIMALCLFLHSFFTTTAARYLSPAQLYPLSQGTGLILSLLMAAILFKEKITPRCMVGILIAFGALVIINL
ncbi:MAG: hypothetical protein IJX39_09455 [Clostridia bacterium]|nr:hypothetical protein [Clostridia bacterium]